MSERKKIKQKLVTQLPYGSTSKIAKTLNISHSKVSRVLNPRLPYWDVLVIEEAMKIVIATNEKELAIRKAI